MEQAMGERERLLMLAPRLGAIVIRPLDPEDDRAAYERFGAALAAEDLRLRFAVPTQWGPDAARRLVPEDATTFAAFDRKRRDPRHRRDRRA
jgi:hypothetical protein